MKKIYLRAGLSAAFVVFQLLYQGCKSENSETVQESKNFCLDEKLKDQIEFTEVGLMQFGEHLQLTAEVECNPDRMFAVLSPVNGFCERVFFKLGDYVKKGQLLAEIKSPYLNQMYAENNSIQSEIKSAQRELDAIESMYDSRLSSEREVVRARSELEKLKIEQQNLQQNLKLYSYNNSNGSFGVYAPSDGYIIEKNLNPGTPISESSQLFSVSDLNRVWVIANVYATDLRLITEGMNVKIQTLAYPDETFSGKISMLSKVFDSEERVLKARIEIDNPDIKLKPGMSADVIAEKRNEIQMPTVRIDDVIFDDDRNYVVIYKSDCDFEIREIKILSADYEFYFIDSGLEPAEKIVSRNQLLIYEQLKSNL